MQAAHPRSKKLLRTLSRNALARSCSGTDPFFISARDQLVTLANRYRRSLAFVAAARLAFLAIKEPETERRLLLPIKNNLGALAPGLSYSLVQHIVSKGIVLGGGGGVEYLPVPRQGAPAGREA